MCGDAVGAQAVEEQLSLALLDYADSRPATYERLGSRRSNDRFSPALEDDLEQQAAEEDSAVPVGEVELSAGMHAALVEQHEAAGAVHNLDQEQEQGQTYENEVDLEHLSAVHAPPAEPQAEERLEWPEGCAGEEMDEWEQDGPSPGEAGRGGTPMARGHQESNSLVCPRSEEQARGHEQANRSEAREGSLAEDLDREAEPSHGGPACMGTLLAGDDEDPRATDSGPVEERGDAWNGVEAGAFEEEQAQEEQHMHRGASRAATPAACDCEGSEAGACGADFEFETAASADFAAAEAQGEVQEEDFVHREAGVETLTTEHSEGCDAGREEANGECEGGEKGSWEYGGGQENGLIGRDGGPVEAPQNAGSEGSDSGKCTPDDERGSAQHSVDLGEDGEGLCAGEKAGDVFVTGGFESNDAGPSMADDRCQRRQNSANFGLPGGEGSSAREEEQEYDLIHRGGGCAEVSQEDDSERPDAGKCANRDERESAQDSGDLGEEGGGWCAGEGEQEDDEGSQAGRHHGPLSKGGSPRQSVCLGEAGEGSFEEEEERDAKSQADAGRAGREEASYSESLDSRRRRREDGHSSGRSSGGASEAGGEASLAEQEEQEPEALGEEDSGESPRARPSEGSEGSGAGRAARGGSESPRSAGGSSPRLGEGQGESFAAAEAERDEERQGEPETPRSAAGNSAGSAAGDEGEGERSCAGEGCHQRSQLDASGDRAGAEAGEERQQCGLMLGSFSQSGPLQQSGRAAEEGRPSSGPGSPGPSSPRSARSGEGPDARSALEEEAEGHSADDDEDEEMEDDFEELSEEEEDEESEVSQSGSASQG